MQTIRLRFGPGTTFNAQRRRFGVQPSNACTRSFFLLLFAVPLGFGFSHNARADDSGALQYNRDVRPILADYCFSCHGPDSAARKADLRLDQREAAIEMGALEPGAPDDSELLRRVLSEDPDEQMPPPAIKKFLRPQQKETLRQWIEQGAPYEPHWSLIAPQRPPLPDVRQTNWVRNPIDTFVLSRLEALGLPPAPEADRRTLARRISLDLTGLPPDPALVERFVQDSSDAAYERLIDLLLQSPRWGEHRARYWLDVARYADTHGIHFDNYREMWAYRDWVIQALNRNQPFDAFTIEQLAGDLLPQPTLQQRIASGFNRCNITTNEGGVIPEEYLVLYTRDRTETVAQAWMGLTAGCAVCHDHKFDPLSQHEFYAMAAFFNNTTQGAMDGNVKDTPPIISVPLEQDLPRWNEMELELVQARQAKETRRAEGRPDFDKWLDSADATALAASLPTDRLALEVPLNEGQGTRLEVRVNGQPREIALAETATWQPGPRGGFALQPQGTACQLSEVGDLEHDQEFTCAAWVKLPANDSVGPICARMDDANGYRGWDFWVQRRQVGMHLIHLWPDNALKVVAQNQIPADRWTHVAVCYDGSGKASGIRVFYDGEEQPVNVEADGLRESIRTSVPWKIGQRDQAQPLSGAVLQDLRIYHRALTAAEISNLARIAGVVSLLTGSNEPRTTAENDQLYDWWLETIDGSYRQLSETLVNLERERNDLQSRSTVAHVTQERNEPAMAYVLFRGEYDARRDPVTPDTPEMLPEMDPDLPRNRLGFAQWLLDDKHPLTARVTVNRFWQQIFGRGLVTTSGDFGVAGELPSHPELLDWLAVEFRESGWDMKRFFKLVLMSATYRQSAESTDEKLRLDPENRFLSRGPRFRMDAEMVRDYALSASGLLSTTIGGPSAKPYQPPGVWEAVAMIGSNTRDYRQDNGENLYRRSLYTFWKRSAPPASMEIFNAPSRETCTVRRERTNTPLQALVTLNDPQFVEAARVLAEQALQSDAVNPHGKIDWIFLRLLARPGTPDEQSVVQAGLQRLLAYYEANPADAEQLVSVGESPRAPGLAVTELAAWTMLANQLMNLDAVLNK